jgi:hypothetical protein
MVTERRSISLFRAVGVGGPQPPILTIEVRDQLAKVSSVAEAQQCCENQASILADALYESLPWGTVKALSDILATKLADGGCSDNQGFVSRYDMISEANNYGG